MKNSIHLEELNNKYADEIVRYLNKDKKLQHVLESTNDKIISCEEYMNITKKWEQKTNSKIFVIMLNTKAIGTITLSHINYENKSAQTGYWICSDYWNKGYTTKAFAQIIELARTMNIEVLSCSIKKYNIASKVIWQKFGADIKEDDERYYPCLKL